MLYDEGVSVRVRHRVRVRVRVRGIGARGVGTPDSVESGDGAPVTTAGKRVRVIGLELGLG